MSEEQMLKEIIEKAVNNGWKGLWDEEPLNDGELHVFSTNDEPPYFYVKFDDNEFSVEQIIFDHSFLKAFFGEEDTCLVCNDRMIHNDWADSIMTCNGRDGYEWQYHAQQLAISVDRIKYLHRFI